MNPFNILQDSVASSNQSGDFFQQVEDEENKQMHRSFLKIWIQQINPLQASSFFNLLNQIIEDSFSIVLDSQQLNFTETLSFLLVCQKIQYPAYQQNSYKGLSKIAKIVKKHHKTGILSNFKEEYKQAILNYLRSNQFSDDFFNLRSVIYKNEQQIDKQQKANLYNSNSQNEQEIQQDQTLLFASQFKNESNSSQTQRNYEENQNDILEQINRQSQYNFNIISGNQEQQVENNQKEGNIFMSIDLDQNQEEFYNISQKKQDSIQGSQEEDLDQILSLYKKEENLNKIVEDIQREMKKSQVPLKIIKELEECLNYLKDKRNN